MSYSANEQIISAPVSFYDVQQALSTTDKEEEELCTEDNINMWSPRKPIYSTKVIPLDNDDWKNPRTLTNYKTGAGIKKYCCSGTDYLAEVTTRGDVNSHIWEYDKPILDGLCAFRISDFSGYWHTAVRKFAITMIYGNIENISVPSSESGTGSNIGFTMYFQKETGQIIPEDLFGDCWSTFYPGVILTSAYGESNKFHYVKTTSNPVSFYVNAQATISISTANFAAQIASDWRARHTGDPYSSAPLRTGDYWTGCVVLLSRPFGGGDGSDHKLLSSDTVVRLEYSQGVDRRTLPIKQTKWNNIDWMKITIVLAKVSGSTSSYDISSITVKAKLLNSVTLPFSIKADLSVPSGAGTVNVQGIASGDNLVDINYSNVTLTGNAGDEITQVLGINKTTYNITNISPGNALCNGTLRFNNSSEGDFEGGWSIDVSRGNNYYSLNVEMD